MPMELIAYQQSAIINGGQNMRLIHVRTIPSWTEIAHWQVYLSFINQNLFCRMYTSSYVHKQTFSVDSLQIFINEASNFLPQSKNMKVR